MSWSTPKVYLADPYSFGRTLNPELVRPAGGDDVSQQVRLLGDIRTLECLFESLATRDLRIYAEAQGDYVFHYREHSEGLGVDLVVEQPSGGWAGF